MVASRPELATALDLVSDVTMQYAIDGNNVLLGLRLNMKPSCRAFATLMLLLQRSGAGIALFFDNSIERHMSEHGVASDWKALVEALKAAGIVPVFAPHADPLIAQHCAANSAAVLNAGDKMDSWRVRPRTIHRARVQRSGAAAYISVIDDATSQLVVRARIDDAFSFGGQHFPALSEGSAGVAVPIAPYERPGNPPEGTLLVFALDASASMASNTTFDGRTKIVHLNDIVKGVIARLRRSRIAEGLYIAVLRFENDVTPLAPRALIDEGTFAPVHEWFNMLDGFDYLKGVKLGHTNIRLALQRSKELIQDALADEQAERLATAWRAAVVLVTDGNHVVQRSDGTTETDDDVAQQAVLIHEGAVDSPLLIGGRIDVGCVGIGKDVNATLLGAIASHCTPVQKRMAALAGIGDRLVDGRLFLSVDSSDSRFHDAIRTFIDVASFSR